MKINGLRNSCRWVEERDSGRISLFNLFAFQNRHYSWDVIDGGRRNTDWKSPKLSSFEIYLCASFPFLNFSFFIYIDAARSDMKQFVCLANGYIYRTTYAMRKCIYTILTYYDTAYLLRYKTSASGDMFATMPTAMALNMGTQASSYVFYYILFLFV